MEIIIALAWIIGLLMCGATVGYLYGKERERRAILKKIEKHGWTLKKLESEPWKESLSPEVRESFRQPHARNAPGKSRVTTATFQQNRRFH